MTIENQLSVQKRLIASLGALNLAPDHQSALQALILLVCDLTQSEAASILRYEEADEYLHFLAMPAHQREAMESLRVPVEGSIAGWVYLHAETLIIQNAKEDKRFFSDVDETVKIQTRSILAVPLLVKGKVVGVMEAINKRNSAHYNGEDVFVLEILAAQAAWIVANLSLEQQAVEMLAATDRLEQMKKDFIAITSHELRTPLGLILGHSTFLREIISDEYHEQIDTIIRNSTKLKDIIENLSKVDNFESGSTRVRMKEFSLANLVNRVMVLHRRKAKEKNIDMQFKLKGKDILLEADEEKIGIALGNVIKNAIAFTPKGKRVLVTLEKLKGYAKLAVVDEGIGIPQNEISLIFERFYQVETHLTRQHGGMGLGLSVAKAMVELHGGKIWAESVLGKGSRFIMLLPLSREQVDTTKLPSSPF